MKTLDEVIRAYECCQNVECDECPFKILFNDDSHVPCDQFSKDEDALHYLKEYRSEKAMWEADRKGYLDWIEQYKESREKHQQAVIELKKNPALTWDELRTMEGKPVWVEALLYKKWAVIAYVGDNHIRFEGVNLYAPESRIYMGAEDGWQAYRKERE